MSDDCGVVNGTSRPSMHLAPGYGSPRSPLPRFSHPLTLLCSVLQQILDSAYVNRLLRSRCFCRRTAHSAQYFLSLSHMLQFANFDRTRMHRTSLRALSGQHWRSAARSRLKVVAAGKHASYASCSETCSSQSSSPARLIYRTAPVTCPAGLKGKTTFVAQNKFSHATTSADLDQSPSPIDPSPSDQILTPAKIQHGLSL